MVAFGYDFSDKDIVEVPDSDKFAIAKFEGNRYFNVEGEKNAPVPRFYAHQIKKIPKGFNKFQRITENIGVVGFETREMAESWVDINGRLGVTHEIRESKEGIREMVEYTEPSDEPVLVDVNEIGVFMIKKDGNPHKNPLKTFETKEDAEKWLVDNNKNQDDHMILGR